MHQPVFTVESENHSILRLLQKRRHRDDFFSGHQNRQAAI